jgi:hypothetical protein
MVAAMRKVISFQKEPSEEDKWLLEAVKEDKDYSDKEAIRELVNKV